MDRLLGNPPCLPPACEGRMRVSPAKASGRQAQEEEGQEKATE